MDSKLKRNIQNIVDNDLCTGCGTCSSFCPENAIEICLDPKKEIFIPQINLHNCNQCGVCLKFCCGKGINYKKLNPELNEIKKNNLLGNYINLWTGYSNNTKIRFNSSSGGMITQILIFALEIGYIDGALVTKMKNDNPLEPEPFIARTKQEIIQSSKSKYCPVPLNKILNKIFNAPNNEKFAVVGLPCHIHGIRNAELTNKKLSSKIVLHLGLFCHHGTNFKGTKFFLDMLKINKSRIRKLNYRGGGWPGYFEVQCLNNVIKKELYWKFYVLPSIYFFTPKRCLKCDDVFNELSDISFGDAWLPKIQEKDNLGTSLLIIRSLKGQRLINEMCSEEQIIMDTCNIVEVIESQKAAVYFKKKNIKARNKISNLIGNQFTISNSCYYKINIFDYLFAITIYCNAYLSANRLVQFISRSLPFFLIKIYHFVFYKFIHSRKIYKL